MNILNANKRYEREKAKRQKNVISELKMRGAHLPRIPWPLTPWGSIILSEKEDGNATINEQINRFNLLPQAIKMITDPNSHFVLEENKVTQTRFWVGKETRNGETITVIIRQIKNGEKHFFSVFSDRK